MEKFSLEEGLELEMVYTRRRFEAGEGLKQEKVSTRTEVSARRKFKPGDVFY